MARQLSTDRFVAKQCRESYYQFFRTVWPLVSAERFKDNWHIKRLCDELQAMLERVFLDKPKEYDFIANVMPGTTKSKVVSVALQPWAWTRMPSFCCITGSYTDRITLDFARQSRDVVQSDLYQKLFPEIGDLRDDQNVKGYFMNRHLGWRFSTSVGGSATGMHAHAILIDDPINPEAALSDLLLEEANNWMTETLSDRKVDKRVTPTALIMQRLHQNDPTGNWLERGGRIKHFVWPCDTSWEIKPAEDVQYYSVEGLFDPIRHSREVLDEAQKRGEAYYAGQYGQNPIPRGGAMFKVDRLRYATTPPEKWKRGPVRFWDKAATRGGKGAFSAGVEMAVDMKDQVWILDSIRGRWDSGTREHNITNTAKKDGKKVRVGVEQEPGSGGKESAESTVKRLIMAGFRAYMNKATGDKELRADPLSEQVNMGNVTILVGPWNHDFVEEMRFFPRSRYKDQIDAASGAHSGLTRTRLRIGALR